ncbi:branched-chain amino acid ABC transporter permease [Limnochorda pilosa]|uniref:Branched-chain amino acid ABC transporter permease n=1 Tax=Limnochorda pilosa TaxID=1555112 RepID=A0A0K2SN39_LIMPI|nr:branched-chain amino acid ABC transporter permease [Limnochorda pilosa]BAS28548.1 branched-chain amino acid ABC transporter permease [Limnochorda pilosa]
MPGLLAAAFALAWAIAHHGWLNPYQQQILMYVGINVILTASLNLVNGYMGEFAVGHAAFMAVGAYVSSLMTVRLFPFQAAPYLFPLALVAGGAAAGVVGLLVAFPSFRTRGDYLAIVTLALNMIVKSAIENVEAIGGPRGFLGMQRLTSLPWVFASTALALYVLRNFIHANLGRGVLAIREDEVAADLLGVDTRRVKLYAFVLSSALAGVAGGLFAHVVQFINPRSFDIIRSTEILVMVYLGGIGSLAGSVIGATFYTVALEWLRFLGQWRLAIAPLLLVLLMILRPTGIMGLREFVGLVPRDERGLRGRLARLGYGTVDSGGGAAPSAPEGSASPHGPA